ncbi:helix-turn-helix domain-containing protein [Leeia sp. TBRC 13508]|uniref:Helix-turn-helix domain-containing protein n=1 Tax=Leeia speluncae TaxID=2884804 RepID=A0ABS8D2D1_9NEIS|nr:helix-turn-helix transcriptional regulator [Leeia speluncae]MCB6182355.1 helix-turn-helix domain-containing protein [Leeia speluncae]
MSANSKSNVIGRRLREARKMAGLPQDRLGVLVGLDEHTASARISRYETGVHEPNFEMAEKLAGILGVPVIYFYCEDDELASLVKAWEKLTDSDRAKFLTELQRST